MQLIHLSAADEAIPDVLVLPSTALSISNRRTLSELEQESGFPGSTRTLRTLIKQDLCSSALRLVRVPAAAKRDPVCVLICPGERIVETAGRLAWTSPSAYVIHENHELRRLCDDTLCATRVPFRLNLTALQDALTRPAGFQPVTQRDLQALTFGDLARARLAVRQSVWDHHVRRLQIKPETCRNIRIIACSTRYLDDVTRQVITLVLDELKASEQDLVKTLLAPLNERPVRPKRRRQTALEKQRNRHQALDIYPFLESIWHTHDRIESPVATSLTAALKNRDLRKLRRAVDDGRPLVRRLARELRLKPWMIEHLRCHWPAYRAFDRGNYPARCWAMGALLSLGTPETAPQTLEELQRLESLINRNRHHVTPLYRSMVTPISSENRRALRKFTQSGSCGDAVLAYLEFLYSLNRWISAQLGQDYYRDLALLLRTKTLDDWWLLARRWHAINDQLQRRAGDGNAFPNASVHLEWPALLTRVESLGGYAFMSLNTYTDLLAESENMKNCASTYVARCALGDSHMIHMSCGDAPVGTLEVRREMYGENLKILLAHAESADHKPLSADAERILHQFLDACNEYRIPLHPDAVQPRSERMDVLTPMLQLQSLDYPTWVQENLGPHYFSLHAHVTGTDLFDRYRDALELHSDAKDSLYQLALRAVRQCRTLNRESREYLELITNAA